jgi:hypothetical protein
MAAVFAFWLLAVAALALQPDVWPSVPTNGPEWPWGTWLSAAGVFFGAASGRRARTAGDAFIRTVGVSAVLVLGVALVKTTLSASEGYAVWPEFVDRQLARSGPLFALASAHGFLVARFVRTRAEAALEWPDQVLRDAGTFAAAAGSIAAVHAVVVDHWLTPEMLSEPGTFASDGMWSGFRIMSLLVAIGSVVAGLAIAGAAHRRASLRRAWLARVRRGEEPDWIVRPPATDDERALPRLLVGGEARDVLAEAPGGSAYREGRSGIARV